MTHAMILTSDALSVQPQTRTLPLLAVVAVRFAFCASNSTTRRRTRAALPQLEAWQLRGVGLTPSDARDEASWVFWKE